MSKPVGRSRPGPGESKKQEGSHPRAPQGQVLCSGLRCQDRDFESQRIRHGDFTWFPDVTSLTSLSHALSSPSFRKYLLSPYQVLGLCPPRRWVSDPTDAKTPRGSHRGKGVRGRPTPR